MIIDLTSLLTTVPTALFSLPLMLLSFYWFISIIAGLDQDLGLDAQSQGVFVHFGLGRVPFCVGLTIFFLTSTIFSALAQDILLSLFFNIYAEDFNPYNIFYITISLVIAFGCSIPSLAITSYITKKLAPAFKQTEGELKFVYEGKKAIVSSSTVNSEFGEILINDGISDHRLFAHTSKNQEFKLGDEVVIVSFDSDKKSYLIEEFL